MQAQSSKAIPKPWVRQLTGTPLVFRAYVLRDGRVVRSCSHRHTRRNGHTGQFYAERCAASMVRRAVEGRDA